MMMIIIIIIIIIRGLSDFHKAEAIICRKSNSNTITHFSNTSIEKLFCYTLHDTAIGANI